MTNLFEGATCENPLKERRVGFIGSFKNRAALIRKVIAWGASPKSSDNLTRDTQILVVGKDVKQEVWNRLLMYEHDGWHPLRINEEDLLSIFSGNYDGFETPTHAKKSIHLDISYYNWTPLYLDLTDEDCKGGIRLSSPLVYGDKNPIYGLEIYVPEIPGVDMNTFRQIIGNFGGYANTEFYDDTRVVLLPDESLRHLQEGISDKVLNHIENAYNNSSALQFNVQFTSESEFINWAKDRVAKIGDNVTKKLLDNYLLVR